MKRPNIAALESIIKGKTLCLIAQGRSIEELERRIEEFRDCDVKWMSFSNFDVVDDYIFSKINRHLDIVFNSAPQEEWVEKEIRVPNLAKAVDRGSLVIVVSNYFNMIESKLGIKDLREREDKLLFVKDIRKNGRIPQSVSFGSNNTLALILAFLIMAEPKKIVLFGCDGALRVGTGEPTVQTYYKPNIIRPRKIRWTLTYDTMMLNKGFAKGYNDCKHVFGISVLPEIYNCSPKSTYTCFKTITYDELKKLI